MGHGSEIQLKVCVNLNKKKLQEKSVITIYQKKHNAQVNFVKNAIKAVYIHFL